MLNLVVYKVTTQPSMVKSPKLVQFRTRKMAQAAMQTTALNVISSVLFSQSKQYQENTLNYAMAASLSTLPFHHSLPFNQDTGCIATSRVLVSRKIVVRIPTRPNIFFFSKALKPYLGPTQSPSRINGHRGIFSLGIRRPCVRLTIHLTYKL